MHTITSLKLKNDRLQIYIDAQYSFSCSHDFIIENRLFNGMHLNSKQLEEIKEKAIKDQLKYKLIEYVYYKSTSKRELFLKLNNYCFKKFKKKLDKLLFEQLFEYVVTKGYYNEADSVEKLVQKYKRENKGDKYIMSKLISKGYSKENVQSNLKENVSDNTDKIREIIDKRLKGRGEVEYKERVKIFQYCLNQGYDYDEVAKVWKLGFNE